MPGKSVALSVRLSQEEASFLATWNPSGVTSLSEKVRMIIKEAAQRQSGTAGYSELLSFWENTLSGPMHQLREAEAENDVHSELMTQFGHWLPDAAALLMARIPQPDSDEATEDLKALEAVIVDRILSLMDQVLRMGITREGPCYDPGVVNRKARRVADVASLLKRSYEEEGEKHG